MSKTVKSLEETISKAEGGVMKLLDACELIVDCPHSTAKDEGSGYPLIRTPNIGRGRLKLDGVHRVSFETYCARNERAVPQVDDLILAREAPVGNVAIIKEGQQVCLGQRTVLIRPNKNIVDPDFLVYYLLSPEMQHMLLSSANGATVSHLNMADIRKLEINLPDLTIQNKIGKLLSVIENRIGNNNEINDNLSDQIQAIYSNEFDPTTHTPTGVLADICSYSSDRIPVAELSISTYFSTENMQPNKLGAVDATSLPSITQTTGCHKGDVLVSNIRPYFKKIVYVTDDSCGCSTDVLCFVPKEKQYSAFLFGTLYMDRFFEYMVAGSKGTKMPRGDKQQIMNYPVVLPDKETLALFNGLIVPMLEQIAANRIESSRLTSLRDALLPKLMSGELDVSEIDF